MVGLIADAATGDFADSEAKAAFVVGGENYGKLDDLTFDVGARNLERERNRWDKKSVEGAQAYKMALLD